MGRNVAESVVCVMCVCEGLMVCSVARQLISPAVCGTLHRERVCVL